MKLMSEQARRTRHITCAACATNLEPQLVPWSQHTLGCRVRTELIARERGGQVVGIPTRVHCVPASM